VRPIASAAATWIGALAAACASSDDQPLAREGPLGSLRDLVLFERAADAGGPFFLDRFEITRGDWSEFAATGAGAVVAAPRPRIIEADDDLLPMAGIDLAQARAFARWRRCRLPRADEWEHARGRFRYPWGEVLWPACANTGELGLGRPLPVGTFESGRRGEGPYDLIGNVGEWTESVPTSWFLHERLALSGACAARARLYGQPGLALWQLPGMPPPVGLLVAVAGDQAPREIVGFDFASSLGPPDQLPTPWQLERPPRDHGDTLGLRLCATPAELLLAVAAEPADHGAAERRQLRRFVARGNHAAVLHAALRDRAIELPAAARAFWAEFLP
jgi:hypothetical protein